LDPFSIYCSGYKRLILSMTLKNVLTYIYIYVYIYKYIYIYNLCQGDGQVPLLEFGSRLCIEVSPTVSSCTTPPRTPAHVRMFQEPVHDTRDWHGHAPAFACHRAHTVVLPRCF